MQTKLQCAISLVLFSLSASAQEFTNHTYQTITATLTWHQAKLDAEARGGYLATITSQAELDYVRSLGVLPITPYWLGATDEAQEGTWVWVTGEPWSFTNWQPGEPNNQGPENYLSAAASVSHEWNDWGREDSTVSYYLLEKGETICTPHKATATAQLVNGFVVGATMINTGCGYTNVPVVLIRGGGGTGATATAQVTDGKVTGIQIISAGCCYTNAPRIVIASPPFVPSLNIEVSRVRVIQNVVLGRKYVLEASTNGNSWSIAAPAFTAEDESVTNEFETDLTGRFFRIRETP